MSNLPPIEFCTGMVAGGLLGYFLAIIVSGCSEVCVHVASAPPALSDIVENQ
jgi:hypothetical protein